MELSRRNFLHSIAAAGGGVLLANKSLAETAAPPAGKSDDLQVVLIGAGKQGRILMESCLRIPGIRFRAVCDIWEPKRVSAARFLKKYSQAAKPYEDYREMLAQEKDLDAAVVATPDWMHAEHANACMNAGLHVYCEKEMSNSLEKAKTMVMTAKSTGKLLQIGHQRRSNPRYLHAINKLIREIKLLGRVTHAYGQWNRTKADLDVTREAPMEQALLDKYGYANMTQLLNWRWFKKYGGGPIVDLGSHQIDLFSWVWGTPPKSVIASGGMDFYANREWYDNVLAIYDFETPAGINRAFYQTLTTTKRGGFYETFMGEDGSLIISEVPSMGNVAEREDIAPPWEPWTKKGYLLPMREPVAPVTTRNVMVDVRVTLEAGKWPLPVELAKPAHQPHLENFFDAIRRGIPLNCPAEIGYETAVAVLAVNDAVASNRRIQFKPEDFRA